MDSELRNLDDPKDEIVNRSIQTYFQFEHSIKEMVDTTFQATSSKMQVKAETTFMMNAETDDLVLKDFLPF